MSATDPLRFLSERHREALATGQGVFSLRPHMVCVADPEEAKDVLGGVGDTFQDHSDFFHSRRGMFGSRETQLRISRDCRTFLGGYLSRHTGTLPEVVRQRLRDGSHWPDAGNWLMYDHLSPALLHPHRPAALRRVMTDIVTHAVLAGARERRPLLHRMVFRRRVMRELAAAIRIRQGSAGEDAGDLLDILALADRQALPADLAEIFLSLLFALVGSIGFVLGWSVYLLGTHQHEQADARPLWIVREALRLWPVAWMFDRTPARSLHLGGTTVTPSDNVVVCPYLVHRHPQRWSQPDAFDPSRWQRIGSSPAYLPFGWGVHACPGASIATDLVAEILAVGLRSGLFLVTSSDHRPQVGPALAPPVFTLTVTAVGDREAMRGGDSHGETG